MIGLSEQQRQAVNQGGAVRFSLDSREVVLLRTDIYRRIQAVLEVERAVIEAGHTRGPVEPPEPLEALSLSSEQRALLGDVAALPVSRYEEIQALIVDDRERAAWHSAVGAAQRSWAQDNPY
jgi:hypothetical protein